MSLSATLLVKTLLLQLIIWPDTRSLAPACRTVVRPFTTGSSLSVAGQQSVSPLFSQCSHHSFLFSLNAHIILSSFLSMLTSFFPLFFPCSHHSFLFSFNAHIILSSFLSMLTPFSPLFSQCSHHSLLFSLNAHIIFFLFFLSHCSHHFPPTWTIQSLFFF